MAPKGKTRKKESSAKRRDGDKPARARGASRAQRSKPRRNSSAPPRTRGLGRGGHRLAEAFAAVEQMPALAEAKRRLGRLTGKPASSESDVAETVESDVALVVAVVRAASNGSSSNGMVWGIADAVETVTPTGVDEAVDGLDSYELFEPPVEWQGQLEPIRRHSVATRHAAIRVAELGSHANWDELALAAMLHDIGQLVLGRLYPGYIELTEHGRGTPEERIQAERRELGIDHALVGGVLTRRWGLPPAITSTIERHHASDAEGAAAVIALADQVAHHSHGDPVSVGRLAKLGASAGVEGERLNALLYEFPHPHTPRKRAPEPCPLSGRELDALRGLAEAKVYKEIAEDLSLSASTVRTHLHNVYRKLGAIDRAQAVLIARDRGWI
jgi:putative nucleotidyltransferase with HDIG domain